MGTLFMVNPPKRRKSRKRRTAAQKAATRKMLAANKAKRRIKAARRRGRKFGGVAKQLPRKRKVANVAKRRRRTTARKAAPRRRRRSSTAKRRSPITTLRRRSVYLTNPRRRKRRVRRFRRNPALFAQLKQGAMDAGATLVGGAIGRMATGALPLPKDGLAGVAASLAVALGVGFAARKVVSADTARFITAGAMQVPIKNLITSFVPQAGAFLGDYDSIGAYALNGEGMGNYLAPGMYGYQQQDTDDVEIGVYE
jgi:hypothetical protein